MSYAFDWSSIPRATPYLLDGTKTTAMLLFSALAIGLSLGTVLAVLRTFAPRWLAMLAGGYVNLFRSIPGILVILWMYFLMPYVLRVVTGNPFLSIGAMYSAIVALGMAEAAYFCEIIRSGLRSVRGGQLAAARALGLTTWQCLQTVMLPQAFRNMMPSLINETVGLLKDTSLVYVISLSDFFSVAGEVGQRDGRLVELYLFAALVYLVVCTSGVVLAESLQRRLAAGH